ncbi:MAG: DNA translocase FtsK 4TM domain-containing protein [Rickettsiaceae bacterium]|nr:DNA translocase FtsK 4TM domain-containing protein [Rickettsiaceae bacterium]
MVKFFRHPKFIACLLFAIGLTSFAALITYDIGDPSFNLATNTTPNNAISYLGSYFADLIYQIIGFAGLLIPIYIILWAYYLFYNNELKQKYVRLMSSILSICFFACVLSLYQINAYEIKAGGVIGMGQVYLLKTFSYTAPYINYIAILLSFICLILFHLSTNLSYKIYYLFLKLVFSKITNITNKIGLIDKVISFDKNQKAFYEIEAKREHFTVTPVKQTNNQARKVLTKAQGTNNILPDISLLNLDDQKNIQKQSPDELANKSEQLLDVLADFGVKGNIIAVKEGPVVTMYEFEPAAGTKSSRVIALADDIARSLSAISARIAVIPGRNALGIELPNKQRMFFRLRQLLETENFHDPNIQLPLILGKDLSGQPLIVDLAKMPHLLVAGTTGSGKSVAINAMIMSLLYRYSPSECKMIMIDPKMLELSAYDNIPHLMTPVVTEPSKAVTALKWAVKEMENRYRLMSHLGVRNIANYNSKLLEATKNGENLERKIQTGFDPVTGEAIFEKIAIDMTKMPFIVVIVDEMADLMLVAGKDIETSIQRLAQMARAAGIHIIMATQRPSVDVITGVIKANFPSRISFKVISKIDSRTILGEQGAEQLLGMGDMLYMGSSSILRVHGPFVDDGEVERVTNFLRNTGSPEYISAITESNEDENCGIDVEMIGDQNDLYSKAVDIVRRERKCSISYIQRCLRIGYNRAANLVEEMERKSVLSAPNHSGKREILLPEE